MHRAHHRRAGNADEGIAFTVNGHISPAGVYTLEGGGYGFYQDFPVTTDENGDFTVSFLFADDGPSPGNGTASDVENIDLTVWVSGDPENTATDEATLAINNVNPEIDWTLLPETGGGFEVRGVVNEYSPAVPMWDRQSVTINWGDGSPNTVISNLLPGEEFSSTHPYPDIQTTYTVSVTAVDDDTGSDDEQLPAQVSLPALTIHDGQTDAPVSDATDFSDGAYSVANQNDTDGDGWFDNSEEDWFEGGGVGTGAGEDEKDLLKLVIEKPSNYVPLTSVALILQRRGNSMRLWNEKTRQTVALDGVDSADEEPTLSVQFGAEASKTFWVELTSPSASLRDYEIRSEYLGKGETVRATAVWSAIVDYEAQTRTAAAVLAEAPWSDMGDSGIISVQLRQVFKGTGIRPIDDLYGGANVIVQAWEPMPQCILDVPRVKFDITRRMEVTRWERTDGDFVQVNHVDMPMRLDEVNDDNPISQDEDGPYQGRMFVFDGPGSGAVPEAPITERALRFNFEEFIRVRFDFTKPTGNNTIDGSRASYKFLWHSRAQVKKVGAEWTRIAAYDDIGPENDYTTVPTPG